MTAAARALPGERLACLIVARNLGDAVIQSGFLKSLAARGYAQRYLVWTRPQVAFLFEDIPSCEVVTSQFPVGTSKQFGGAAVFKFLQAAWRIRRHRPSVTLDLIGDVRERCFARLAGSWRHVHIGWAVDHPFTRLIRNPLGIGKPLVSIPSSVANVYDGYRKMLDALMPERSGENIASRPADSPQQTHKTLRIGLHPFASQKCKLWPDENWRELVRDLLAHNAEISAFGAPSERPALEALFAEFGQRVELITGSIPNFARVTAGLDVMVGLDSFSVHMAQRQGIRSVMINAGNPPDLWAPPGGVTLASSGGCPNYPCFNVPACEETDRQYACVRSINAEHVSVELLKADLPA